MSARLAMLALLCLGACCLQAGIWDQDRPSKGSLPSHYDIITGRFDRYPNQYYEQRLKAIRKQISAFEIESAPTSQEIADILPLFDSAGIALFRLGKHGDAIIMLDRKAALVAKIREDKTAIAIEQENRATSNRSAVLFHRWRLNPKANAIDLQTAIDALKQLTTENAFNADANWSLSELVWLDLTPEYKPDVDPLFPNLLGLVDASFRGELNEGALARNSIAGCLKYLSRRIVYEDGWDDVDVFYGYSLALALSGRKEESLFAWFRVCELIDEGKTTHVGGAPAPKALKRLLGVHVLQVTKKNDAERVYQEVRKKADTWHKSRNAFLLAALADGRHPDNDAVFWDTWSETHTQPQPGRPEDIPEAFIHPAILFGGIGGFMIVLLGLICAIFLMGRRTASAPNVDDL